jgi:hypothetical protein
LNPKQKKIPTLINYVCQDELGHNYVWNLMNLCDANTCGTVEFQGAGMSLPINNKRKCVTFVIGFKGGENLATND